MGGSPWHALLLASLVLGLSSAPANAWDPTVTAIAPPGGPSSAAAVVRYQRPVAGEVVRRFDAPTSAYGPGHRGVDIAGPPGGVVRSAGDGTVSYAGTVANAGWVAVTHPDGVVTSYGPLGELAVRRGARVERGDRLGVLAAGGHGRGEHDVGLHWGARRDGRYLDPLRLLDGAMPRPSLVGPGGWHGTAHVVRAYEPWAGARAGGWRYAPSPTADRPGFAVAPSPNHLVVVPGLATSSESTVLDADHLGYDPRSVTRFSYAGRTDAPGPPDDARRDQLPYGPEHTWPGVDAAALRLRDQLRAQAAREPGRAVDLIGHSMGGVVILRYLTEHHDAYDRSLPPIGHVVTFASPHAGSDLAALAGDVASHGILGRVSSALQGLLAHSDTALGRRVATLPLDAPAIDELRPGSPLLRELASGVEHALHDGPSGALAMGTRVLTIGGGGDQVVGAYRTRLPRDPGVALERALDRLVERDAGDVRPRPSSDPPGRGLDELGWQPWADGPPLEHRVLPGNHERVVRTEAAREVAWRFLAGDEVVASPGRLAHLTSEEGGTALRLTGLLLRAHDLAWSPLRRAMRPTTTVPRLRPGSRDHLGAGWTDR